MARYAHWEIVLHRIKYVTANLIVTTEVMNRKKCAKIGSHVRQLKSNVRTRDAFRKRLSVMAEMIAAITQMSFLNAIAYRISGLLISKVLLLFELRDDEEF